MTITKLSKFLDELEITSSRIEITKILSQLFKNVDESEIKNTVNLILGRLAPSYENIVFNLADKTVLKAIAESSGISLKEVTKEYKKLGDIGNTASTLTKKDKTSLSVNDVYENLYKIAVDEGGGSQERKITQLAILFSKLDNKSVKFVARIPLGKLRLGFSDKTILDALSWMEKGDKSEKTKLENAYQVLPDVALLAQKVKKNGIEKATVSPVPQIGVPIMPMLAQRIKSPAEMIKKMGEVAVEPKLDGLRLSIHLKKGKNGFVKAFTRNLNETSQMFPELNIIAPFINGNEVILDAEAVGVDEITKSVANFQSTMTRRRKHEIEEYADKLPMQFYVFDILYKDGKGLIGEDYLTRRKVLEETIIEGGPLKTTDFLQTTDPDTITKTHEEKILEGLEGVVVKKVKSHYVPGRTGWRWVKMKEAAGTSGKLADTLDCVIMGYSAGKGKRADFGIGQFLAGIVDSGKVKTVTKVGTGLTDDQFRELHNRLKKIETEDKPKSYIVDKNLKPDYWVTPDVIVELAADEITKSPNHTAGYALRFPRLVRFRDDKSLDQATTIEEFLNLAHLS